MSETNQPMSELAEKAARLYAEAEQIKAEADGFMVAADALRAEADRLIRRSKPRIRERLREALSDGPRTLAELRGELKLPGPSIGAVLSQNPEFSRLGDAKRRAPWAYDRTIVITDGRKR